jgi:hypothetical protein
MTHYALFVGMTKKLAIDCENFLAGICGTLDALMLGYLLTHDAHYAQSQ